MIMIALTLRSTHTGFQVRGLKGAKPCKPPWTKAGLITDHSNDRSLMWLSEPRLSLQRRENEASDVIPDVLKPFSWDGFFCSQQKCTFIQPKATVMLRREKMFPTLVSLRDFRDGLAKFHLVSNKADQDTRAWSEQRTQENQDGGRNDSIR